MRLDKFCKVSRLLKRRSIAKELADHQRILLNGKPAKPAHEVQVNDILTLQYGNRRLTVRILQLNENPRKEEAGSMVEVLEETFDSI